ncbi:uncharacterized protein [Aegilops tauschii subsp. strangulata]|nr:serine/arginine repetitive matrix protein 1 [Aegilops tauschii subsp. strangulata]
MKQPAASPGRAEKPPQQQQLPAPPGLARLLLSKSRRGARSRRAPATSPMFVSRGRSRAAAAADGEPSSPKVTCIGQVRMRKGKKGNKKGPPAPPLPPAKEEKARGYCRCLKKAFLCGGLFDFDRTRRRKGPAPEAERTRRSPWVFSSRDVAVAAAPKPPDPASDRAEEEGEEDDKSVGAFGSVERDEKADEPGTDSGGTEEEGCEEGEAAELVSSGTTTPPKNALLLMRCRSAPQNRSSPLTSRFAAGAAPSPVQEAADYAVESIAATPPRASPSPRKPEMLSPWASPSPRKPDMLSPWASPSPRKPDMLSPWASPSRRKLDMLQSPRASPSPRKPDMVAVEGNDEKRQKMAVSTQEDEEKMLEQKHEADDDEAEEMRCSSARPLVLQRCKSEPATTAAAKMAAGAGAEGAPSGCFWANGGSSGRRRHAPQMSPAAAAPVALTGH